MALGGSGWLHGVFLGVGSDGNLLFEVLPNFWNLLPTDFRKGESFEAKSFFRKERIQE